MIFLGRLLPHLICHHGQVTLKLCPGKQVGQTATSWSLTILQVHVATVLTSEGTAGDRMPGPELGWPEETQGRQRPASKATRTGRTAQKYTGCLHQEVGRYVGGGHLSWEPRALVRMTPGPAGSELSDTRGETVPEERLPRDQGWCPHRSVPSDR